MAPLSPERNLPSRSRGGMTFRKLSGSNGKPKNARAKPESGLDTPEYGCSLIEVLQPPPWIGGLLPSHMVEMNAMCCACVGASPIADDWMDTSPTYSHPFRPDSKPLISPA